MADYKLINGRVSRSLPSSAKSLSSGAGRPKSRGQIKSGKSAHGIPIHVDGSRDELSDVDPDLTLAELELLGEAQDATMGQGSATTESWGRTVAPSRMSDTDRSRARPIKPHEAEPFLAVGSVVSSTSEPVRPATTDGNVRVRTRQRPRSLRSGVTCNRAGCATPTSNGLLSLAYRSPYSSPAPSLRVHSARSTGRRTTSKMYVSPCSVTPRPNPHIKMPFKHSIRKPSDTQGQEPSQELKEMTAMATYHVNRILAGDMGSVTKKQQGRLKKGRLKPLYPVEVTGPSINQCRGILAETRSFASSASRTLQRRRQIFAQLKSGQYGDYSKPSHPLGGSDSVHRVSAASSVEDLTEEVEVKELTNGDDFQKELASMEEDALFSQELEEKMLVNNAASGDAAVKSLPNAASSEQDTASVTTTNIIAYPAQPLTDIPAQTTGETMETNTEPATSSGKIAPQRSASAEAADRTHIANNSNNNFLASKPHSCSPQQVKRPQSASVQYSEPVVTKPKARGRPQTATSVKAVRFADLAHSSDGTKLPLSRSSFRGEADSDRDRDRDRDKENKKKGSGDGSCKPSHLHHNRRDDDNDDDSKGGGGGGGGSGGGGVSRSTAAVATSGGQGGESRPGPSGSGGSGSARERTPHCSNESIPQDQESPTAAGGDAPINIQQREDSDMSKPCISQGQKDTPSAHENQTSQSKPTRDEDGINNTRRSTSAHTDSSGVAEPPKTVDGVEQGVPAHSSLKTEAVTELCDPTQLSHSSTTHGKGTEKSKNKDTCTQKIQQLLDHPPNAHPALLKPPNTPSLSCVSVSEASSLTSSSLPPREEVEEGGPKALPPPPVTWTGKAGLGAGTLATKIPDSSRLLKLLLEVSAEVDGELQQSLSQQNSDVSLTDGSASCASQREAGRSQSASSVVSDISMALCVTASDACDKEEAPWCESGCDASQTDSKIGGSDQVLSESACVLRKELGDSPANTNTSAKKVDSPCADKTNTPASKVVSPAVSITSTSAMKVVASSANNTNTTANKVTLPRVSDNNTPTNKVVPPSHSNMTGQTRTTSQGLEGVTMVMQGDQAVNPRVGVFVCQHSQSPRIVDKPLPLGDSAVQGLDQRREPVTFDQSIPRKHGEGYSTRQGMKSDRINDRHGNVEDVHGNTEDEHSNAEYEHGNTITELFTHFSLGTDGVSPSPHPPYSSQSQVCRSAASSNSMSTTGILKKKSSSAVEHRTATASKAGSREMEKGQVKPRAVRRRQTFTHRSSQPFVYPTGDTWCQAVADQLKFGDSPYLREITLPGSGTPKPTRKVKGGVSKSDCLPTNSEDRSVLAASDKPHLKDRMPRIAERYRRPTRVKFADFSIEMLNLNQNCDYGDHDSTFITQDLYLCEEDESRTSPLSGQCDEGVFIDEQTLPEECPDGEDEFQKAYDQADNMVDRFSVLEAELATVRSDIKHDLLDSQADQRLDQILCSNHVEEVGEIEDMEEEDDGFVYEDDGTSDEEEREEEKETKTREEEPQKMEDDDDAYSTYYRSLLLEYRRKCVTVGEGNLVISDKLTWPYAASRNRPSSSSTNTSRSSTFVTKTRPHSAGAFRTLADRHHDHTAKKHHSSVSDSSDTPAPPRPASRSDSGWESDGMSDAGGRGFTRWNSLLSVDGESVFSTSSERSGTPVGAARQTASPGAGGAASRVETVAVMAGSRPSSGREDNPQLSVVAAPVPKQKLPQAPPKDAPVAPFPPLCFAVNARPPPGFLFYFAYSSYMNPDRLGSLLNRQIEKRYWAVLFGFDLAFNKKGSEESAGGLANVVFNPFSSVEGCIVVLTPQELDRLDAFTSAPQHYARVVLPVWMSEVSGSTDDLGLARYCVPAVTYIAHNDWTMEGDCPPNEFVASQCLKSADLLTPSYCDRLRSLVPSSAPQATVS